MKNSPVRRCSILIVLLLTGCDFWPKPLDSLATSIARQVSGETTAFLMGGDVVVIDVTGSPRFQDPLEELEALASELATQAQAAAGRPLESIIVTFQPGPDAPQPVRERDFIFVVQEGRPVLQPAFDVDATGPMTAEELDQAVGRIGDGLTPTQRACVAERLEASATAAGDPERLDPETVEFLSADTWAPLDPFGKRLILVQALATEAVFQCVQATASETK